MQNNVKINVDGSVKSQTGRAFVGSVLRNDHGDWILGFYYGVGVCDILTAELWAIYHGLVIGWDKGFRNFEVETNSMTAVKKISNAPYLQDTNGRLI
ncbi:hypothetical protein REPUB_Repub17cG0171200 [Reevesia pubescens]